MRYRFLLILSLILLVGLGLAACSSGPEPKPPEGVSIVTPRPSEIVSPTTLPPTSIPASLTPSPTLGQDSKGHTPSPIPPSTTPTSIPASPTPSATLEQTRPAHTPTAIPPSATPTPAPLPTATPFPETDLAAIQVELRKVVGGLDTPVGLANAGDGSGRLFVVEKPGRVRILENSALNASPFLDISDRVGSSQSEQGLLGLAFHPDYVSNGFLFVNYTDLQGNTVVSRFASGGNPDQADPGNEMVLLTFAQPAANHNGGHLAFGPDGYLYIGTGDGGAAGDKYGNGQNGQTLLGAMLRLDVDRGQPYTVPTDNPFIGDPDVLDEIWALGLRNPWRYSFDSLTGDLYVADVGQNRYEEINLDLAQSPGGHNYGWPIMEGAHCYPEDRDCDQAGLTLPIAEYEHSQGCSVTGGYVYRGQAYPLLAGVYVFGDFCSGRIWGLAQSDGGWTVAELAETQARISAFGQDETGELYLLDMAGGELYSIAARPK